MNSDLWLALFAGVGVAAACGLRAFLPLLLVGLAARLGWVELQAGSQWLASTPALACFAMATALEIAADKVPVVDHSLDLIGTVLRPFTAWLAAYAVLVHWDPMWAQIIALILGGGALAVHSLKANLRLGSTAITLGHANPALSVTEDAASLTLGATALLAPVAALAIVALVFWTFLRRRRRRRLPA